MGLNAYIQRCSILQLFIDLLVDHGFSREVTRVRFYFLLPTSKNFCGSLPTKTINLYSAFYALIIVKVIVIVMDVIIQVFQTIVQRAFCTLSSLCRQLYLYRQLSLCIQLCFCRHPWSFLFFLDAFSHLYKRVCPSVRPSVGPSVCRSVRRSVTHKLKS